MDLTLVKLVREELVGEKVSGISLAKNVVLPVKLAPYCRAVG